MDGSNTTGTEYVYDANGNLTQDLNKKISNIQYNTLNLPLSVQFSTGAKINYVYGTDGVKRKTTHQSGSTTTTIDYCGNVIYENGVLSKILTEEGYVTLNGSTPTYHYYLKDHLGNNRVVMNNSGTVEQVNHYYPFGGSFGTGTDTSNQPYKFSGKELDKANGLNWYDFGARGYDPELGRFIGLDPLSEHSYSFSSYAYCGNNPINYIDPDGRDWYEDELGNVFWREGGNAIQGYKNLGSNYSIAMGGGGYLNYYQNAIVSESNMPSDAFQTISRDVGLQNSLLGKRSPLSENSKSQLFNGLVNEKTSSIGQAVGEGLLTAEIVVSGAGSLGTLGRVGSNLLIRNVVKSGELFKFGTKAAEHMGESSRFVPIQVLEQAIKTSKGMPDPKGSRALMYTVEMWKNGKKYTLEVLYDKTTNAIWHFKYK